MGSALIDPEFKQKKEICDQLGIRTLLGGTFLVRLPLWIQAFVEKIKYFSLDCVEVSRGTIELEDHLFAEYIRTLSTDFLCDE